MLRFTLSLCIALYLFSPMVVPAQENTETSGERARRVNETAKNQADDTIRVNTRVVFVDVSVKDAKTNAPVRDLSLKNFQILDDGKSRSLSYFTREGDTRRPLSLLIFIDLWSMYGRKYIKQRAAMSRLADALRSLAPEDQVAVMSTWIEEGTAPNYALPKVKTLSGFTSDRVQTIAALRKVPELVVEQEKFLKAIEDKAGLSQPDLEVVWSLADIAEVVMPQAHARPTRQFVVTGLIDDLFTLKRGERDQVAELAARTGITFYGLIYKKSVAGKIFLGAINQMVMRPSGKSIHAADYLAKQTGGQTISVGRADDLATGLESVISDLMSRYSLGFSLEDDEKDDGEMHHLEVKVEATDGKGKKRLLKTRARQSYYKPATEK